MKRFFYQMHLYIYQQKNKQILKHREINSSCMATIYSNLMLVLKKVLAVRNDSRTTPYISCTFLCALIIKYCMNTPTFYLISILLFFNCIFCNFRFIVTTFSLSFFTHYRDSQKACKTFTKNIGAPLIESVQQWRENGENQFE